MKLPHSRKRQRRIPRYKPWNSRSPARRSSKPKRGGVLGQRPGLFSKVVQCSGSGPVPQNRQLVLVMPTDTFDMEKDAVLGEARGIQWWEPKTPLHCKLVDTDEAPLTIPLRQRIAKIIVVQVHDAERFNGSVQCRSSHTDRPSPLVSADRTPPTLGKVLHQPDPADRVKASDANCCQLGEPQNEELVTLLSWFINHELFPTDPKKLPECLDGE